MSDRKQAPETQDEWTTLAGLLPPSERLSTGSASASHESSLWTDEELGRARSASIRQHLRAGWKFVEGLLKKGNFSKPASTRSPVPQPWEIGYNPMEHSVGVRMGGTYIAPGRYRLEHNGMVVDDNGSLVDDEACLGCGTRRGPDRRVVGPDYRWTVRGTHPNPFAAPWDQSWTYCRKCVTQDELVAKRNFEERERLKAMAEQSRR